MGDVRVSPDGQYVAFTQHPLYGDNTGSVAIVDMQGHTRSLMLMISTPDHPAERDTAS